MFGRTRAKFNKSLVFYEMLTDLTNFPCHVPYLLNPVCESGANLAKALLSGIPKGNSLHAIHAVTKSSKCGGQFLRRPICWDPLGVQLYRSSI